MWNPILVSFVLTFLLTHPGATLCAQSAPAAPTKNAAPANAARDWVKYPAIVEFKTTEDVYALADIHGDYERCVSLLVNCKILATKPDRAENAKWNAGKAVLVCTGDMIDKWTQSVNVLLLMRALQGSAERAGGKVIITYGNHEAE